MQGKLYGQNQGGGLKLNGSIKEVYTEESITKGDLLEYIGNKVRKTSTSQFVGVAKSGGIAGALINMWTLGAQEGYITNGLVAHFSGEDGYVDGAWVDRISGYKFTPISTSTAPVYDEYLKLYEATTFGGMKSDFKTPASSEYSFEITVRDFKNITSNSMTNNYATLMGGEIDQYTLTTDSLRLYRVATGASSEPNKLVAVKGGSSIHVMDRSEFEDNGLDTFTFIPEVGIFRNGLKIADLGGSSVARGIGLFTEYSGLYTSYFRGKGKIHSVRMYNRQLTPEEVAQNYEMDKEIYEHKVDTDNYVDDGLVFYLSGEDVPIDNKWYDRIAHNPTTLYNSPSYDNGNKCYSFNGTNQYGRFDVNSVTSGDFTLEVYYKQDQVGPFDVMCGTARGSAKGYGILNNSGTNYAWINSSSTITLPSADRPTQVEGRKTYNRLSRETANMHFNLIDSSRNVYKTFTGTSANLNVSDFRIANSGTSNIYSKCQIYSIRLYNRKLTDEEIAQNYAEDVRIYGE